MFKPFMRCLLLKHALNWKWMKVIDLITENKVVCFSTLLPFKDNSDCVMIVWYKKVCIPGHHIFETAHFMLQCWQLFSSISRNDLHQMVILGSANMAVYFQRNLTG